MRESEHLQPLSLPGGIFFPPGGCRRNFFPGNEKMSTRCPPPRTYPLVTAGQAAFASPPPPSALLLAALAMALLAATDSSVDSIPFAGDQALRPGPQQEQDQRGLSGVSSNSTSHGFWTWRMAPVPPVLERATTYSAASDDADLVRRNAHSADAEEMGWILRGWWPWRPSEEEGDGPRALPRPCALCGRKGRGEEKENKERGGERRERGADEWPCACKSHLPTSPAAPRGAGFGVVAPAVNLAKFGEKRLWGPSGFFLPAGVQKVPWGGFLGGRLEMLSCILLGVRRAGGSRSWPMQFASGRTCRCTWCSSLVDHCG
ncbi:uncharacterized protein [Triticum aestivum]|uniref:uncharacterized protein n=1 Tax=Triticum aestivum TaxID=4565 RepID=UPI001D004FCC|nr:uncharacterized protein LOC123167914 [Triticum aestivum]XP_044441717.1 uncharacterized protein LOC123167914 [Triticum aestivum]